MENLTEKLNTMLQDPETMSQLQSLAAMLGVPAAPPAKPVQAPATPSQAAEANLHDIISPDMMGTFVKLAPMLRNLRRETPSTQFLHALRPLLSGTRQKKLDDAVRLMQLMNLLPVLQQSGLLNQLI